MRSPVERPFQEDFVTDMIPDPLVRSGTGEGRRNFLYRTAACTAQFSVAVFQIVASLDVPFLGRGD